MNSADAETPVHVTLAGVKDGTANTIVLAAEPMAENSLNAPTAIAPVEQPATVSGSAIDRVLPKRSLTVLRVRK